MTLLRDLSVIWALINIMVFFLIIMEFRIPVRRLAIFSSLLLAVLLPINMWYLLTYGPARMAQSFFYLLILPCVCFYFFFSKYRDGRFLYSFFLICDLNADLTCLTYILDLVLPGERYMWMFILRLILFPLLNIVAYKWIREPYLRVQHSVERGWVGFSVAAALFDFLAIRLFSYPVMIEERPNDLIPLLLVIALTLLTNVYFFIALVNQQGLHEARERAQILAVQTDALREKLRGYADSAGAHAIERHDMRHRYRTLLALIADGKNDAAREYLERSYELAQESAPKRWCKNSVLDAVLSYYFSEAESAGIRIEAELDISEDVAADTTELSTVFANAIENAINAVKPLPEGERVIKCRCIDFPQLMFRISNPYRGELKWSSDGLPASAGGSAGTGSRSISAYCEKHGAWCDYCTEDGWFTMQIIQA